VGLAFDLVDYHRPSVLRHCWLGHVTRKTVSEMTYNVSSGTLNSTIPYYSDTIAKKCCRGTVQNVMSKFAVNAVQQIDSAIMSGICPWTKKTELQLSR